MNIWWFAKRWRERSVKQFSELHQVEEIRRHSKLLLKKDDISEGCHIAIRTSATSTKAQIFKTNIHLKIKGASGEFLIGRS